MYDSMASLMFVFFLTDMAGDVEAYIPHQVDNTARQASRRSL